MTTVRTREVDSGDVRGHLALPDATAPAPGLVVVHDVFGLNDHMRDVARRLAEHGYAALAVDLVRAGGRAVCMARAITAQLTTGRRATGALRDALTYLAQQPEIDGERLGAVGFCMGGTYVLAWACADTRLRAIAPFYGMNPRPLEAVARGCPVVGSYPGKDFTARSGRRLEETLTARGVAHDVKVYPGARHSFFNDTLSAHDPVAAADAWERTLRFLDSHVARTSPAA